MDIVEEIKKRMSEEQISEEELSKKTGIEEYNIYYLLTYQQYISRIGVIALDTVLGLGVEDIDAVIERNKAKVGAPETNLEIAHKMVDPSYVEQLNKEIIGLTRNKGTIESKNEYIGKLVMELKEKDKEIKELEEKVRTSRAEGYREGNRRGAENVEQMGIISIEKEIQRLTQGYKDAMKNTERVLEEEQGLYTRLYKYILSDGRVDIGDFRLPRGYTREEVEEELAYKEEQKQTKEEMEQMQLVYELTHGLGMEQTDIEVEMGITGEEYRELYRKYKEHLEEMVSHE